MSYFSRRVQLQRFFKDLPYESFEMGEEAPTMEEAVGLVEKAVANYVQEKRQELQKLKNKSKNTEVPFETPNQVSGTIIIKSKKYDGLSKKHS